MKCERWTKDWRKTIEGHSTKGVLRSADSFLLVAREAISCTAMPPSPAAPTSSCSRWAAGKTVGQLSHRRRHFYGTGCHSRRARCLRTVADPISTAAIVDWRLSPSDVCCHRCGRPFRRRLAHCCGIALRACSARDPKPSILFDLYVLTRVSTPRHALAGSRTVTRLGDAPNP